MQRFTLELWWLARIVEAYIGAVEAHPKAVIAYGSH
jgi:hypothetical protein